MNWTELYALMTVDQRMLLRHALHLASQDARPKLRGKLYEVWREINAFGADETAALDLDLDEDPSTEEVFPWKQPELIGWSIVGMKHYRLNGAKQLFVALVRDGHCIQAEGGDVKALWEDLRAQARTFSPT